MGFAFFTRVLGNSSSLHIDVTCLETRVLYGFDSRLGRLRFFPFLPKLHFQFPFPPFPSSFFPFLFLSLPLPLPSTFRLRFKISLFAFIPLITIVWLRVLATFVFIPEGVHRLLEVSQAGMHSLTRLFDLYSGRSTYWICGSMIPWGWTEALSRACRTHLAFGSNSFDQLGTAKK